jgi:hypothetical protein
MGRSSLRGCGFALLLVAGPVGCYAGTGGGGPSGPEDLPNGPPIPVEVGAVIYGTFLVTSPIFPSSLTFDVLDADCIRPVQGVEMHNRFHGKRKLSYKYQLKVQRLPFQACVRIRATYSRGEEEAVRIAEASRYVLFTTQGAGLAPVGVQVDIPLP